MKITKHEEILKEVEQTINSAIKDKQGLLMHQRRLMSMISLGASNLIELYLHNLNVIDPGISIKHNWFSKSKEKIKLKLDSITSKNLNEIKNMHEIIGLINQIEQDRNEIIYGAPVTDKVLRRKIDAYLELKKLCDYETD